MVLTGARPTIGPQQKDNLCGPYWAARTLLDAGIKEWSGTSIDDDLIALRAGATLPPPGGQPSVPAGAQSLARYRYELRVVPAEVSGTSVMGLVNAIEGASAGELRCVPIRGDWTAERVERLLTELSWARLVANIQTGCLWGSRPPVQLLLSELAGGPVEPPPADWDVGHFVWLEMLLRGQKNSLVVVHDSYPSLGIDGRHLQPPRALAEALRRRDGRQGGVLAVVSDKQVARVVKAVAGTGLEVGLWDNGSRSEGDGES